MKKKKVKILISILFIIIVGASVAGILLFSSKPEEKLNKVEEKKEPEIVEEVPKEKRMSLVAVGDALIHQAVYADAALPDGTYDFHKMFTEIEPLINNYDLKYYNQESIIGGKSIGLSHYPRLNSPEEIGENLVDIGFNMVSLANNHSFDKDEIGLINSLEFWHNQETNNGVIISGQNSSFEEQENIKVYEKNGIKFSFMSYTMCTNGLSAPYGQEYYVNVYDEDIVKRDVEQAKNNGAEVIIVAMHWGEEYIFDPTYIQKETAQYLSSLGVNLIIGAHPHVIMPVDYVGDTLVLYSLGNFISGQSPLGIDKIIGLMAGMDIVVSPEGKVTFENIDYKLIYTYSTSSYTNYKLIPFDNLTDDILYNHEQIEQEYMAIVNNEVYYD